MFKTYKTFSIIALVLIGAFLRLWNLGSYPAGFFRDEATLGYNAYSIWLTGRDEYGMLFPKVFRSFEVFFLPLYEYLSAPIVGILGLSELSTRLLSAISGVCLLLIIYLIAKEIWNQKSAIFSLLVLTVSPWHIFYSRGTFEGNLALTLFSAGVLFWLKFVKNNKVFSLFLSAFFLTLSMYSYQAERLVVPLFVVVALSFSFSKIWNFKGKLVLPCAAIFIMLLPLLSLSFQPGGYHRAFGVSIFSQEKNAPGWVQEETAGLFLNNNYYLRARQVAALYLSYFSPRNLFAEGDFDKQRSVENFSVFYSWMLPFLIVGFWFVSRQKSLNDKLLFSWMFLAPIPAALTGDPFHTYRSLLLYLPISLLIGFGLSVVFDYTKKSKVFVLVIILLSLISTSSFSFSYFLVNQSSRARAWDYGYKELIRYLTLQTSNDSKVVIDDLWTESYIQFLFFDKTDPKFYQKEVASLGDVNNYYYSESKKIRPYKIGNFEFRTVDWAQERGNAGAIFAISADRLPEDAYKSDPRIELLKEIYYPNGQAAYRIIKVK